MIENLQKRKKKSNFDPFRKRTESIHFAFQPAAWLEPAAGFSFSVSQKNAGVLVPFAVETLSLSSETKVQLFDYSTKQLLLLFLYG